MENSNELAIRPIGPLADQFKAGHSVSEAENQSARGPLSEQLSIPVASPDTQLTLTSKSILGLAVSWVVP
jgi:hypothetical protein